MIELVLRDLRHRGSQSDQVRLRQNQPQGYMKDPRKNKPKDFEETQSLDEQIAADLRSGDTQRMRSLTAQDLERLLKDKKPAR